MKKECSLCGETKNADEFYSQKRENNKRGKYIYYNPECKSCTKKRFQSWRENNRERDRENDKRYKKSQKGFEMRRRKVKKYIATGKRQKWLDENREKMSKYHADRRMNKTHNISDDEWINCKEYFNNSCAYCGMSFEEHLKTAKQDFHKEHVIHDGSNGLDNCIPSCRYCNSRKWAHRFEDWYVDTNPVYATERYYRIKKWLEEDHLYYII